MHYQVTGQRIISGGYQLFTASGFGTNEHEAIADALASHPDRTAWQPHELRAEVDPISLGSSKVEPTLYKGQVAGSTPALATNLAGLTNGSVDLDNGQKPNGHRARAGATPAASFNLPTVAYVLASLALFAGTFAAYGGQSISAGFSEMSPRTVATRAGRGMDARKEPFASEFESLPVKTAGPADSISVAAWRDTQRPHRSEPWLSPDSLGAQSERAVKHETLDRRGVASPTENLSVDRYPLPDRAVTRDLVGVQPYVRQRDAEGSTEFNVHPSTGFSAPASVPSRVGGVGNRNATANDTPNPRAIAGGGAISPAVGGNRTDLHAKRELREETGYRVAVPDAPLGRLGQREQSALSDQPGGMPGTFSAHRLAWLAKAFAVSSVIITGIAAISALMLAGRLEEK